MILTFLSQVLDHDHSCRQAVARLLAFRSSRGLRPCSPDTGAYCKARSRLPEALLQELTRATGRRTAEQAPPAWLWQGRPVKIVDGTGLSMPDTPANQKAYPKLKTLPPGVGFPLVRLVVVFHLAVGTVLDAALGRRSGKGTGEQSLFRSLWAQFRSGDVVLGDRLYGDFFTLALARARGRRSASRGAAPPTFPSAGLSRRGRTGWGGASTSDCRVTCTCARSGCWSAGSGSGPSAWCW